MTPDLFEKPKPLTLTIRGLGVIPNFKNTKMIIPPSLKAIRKAIEYGNLGLVSQAVEDYSKKRPALITSPEMQQKMQRITAALESELRSAIQTNAGEIPTEQQRRSLTAWCVPDDDSWTRMPIIEIKAELCQPGEEGATIEIERL